MRRTNFAVVLALVLLAALIAASVASAAIGTDSSKLRSAVTVNGIMKHQKQF